MAAAASMKRTIWGLKGEHQGFQHNLAHAGPVYSNVVAQPRHRSCASPWRVAPQMFDRPLQLAEYIAQADLQIAVGWD
jgi:hypothetical protein